VRERRAPAEPFVAARSGSEGCSFVLDENKEFLPWVRESDAQRRRSETSHLMCYGAAVTDSVETPRAPALRVSGLAGIWLAVVAFELIDLPNLFILILVIPIVELALWLAAIALTWRALRHISLPQPYVRVVQTVVVVGLLALVAWFNNWSVIGPRGYYAVHRRSFAAITSMVDSGQIDTSTGVSGTRLPRHLADLATDGRAKTLGTTARGTQVVALEQFVDFRKGLYYAYVGNEHADAFFFDLSGAIDLGDGWWWVVY
jgi:hypothetical protein